MTRDRVGLGWSNATLAISLHHLILGGEIMLRALCLTTLMLVAAPSIAAEPAEATVVAQENKAPPQQAPKRDCERRQEGVS